MRRLCVLVCITMAVGYYSVHGAVKLSASDRNTFVNLHNNARAAEKHGLHKLVWDNNLANKASMVANKCIWQHTPSNIRKWGENLYYSTAKTMTNANAARKALNNWVGEKRLNTNGQFNCNGCGHYTQVIWGATRRVGCAVNHCRNNPKLGTFVVCTYDPPGNVSGRKPY